MRIFEAGLFSLAESTKVSPETSRGFWPIQRIFRSHRSPNPHRVSFVRKQLLLLINVSINPFSREFNMERHGLQMNSTPQRRLRLAVSASHSYLSGLKSERVFHSKAEPVSTSMTKTWRALREFLRESIGVGVRNISQTSVIQK